MDTLHKDNFFSTSQVAEILGVTRITVFRWIKEGTLKAEKIGRNYVISHEELNKHLDSKPLSDEEKTRVTKLVHKTIEDYGETIRMLGRE